MKITFGLCLLLICCSSCRLIYKRQPVQEDTTPRAVTAVVVPPTGSYLPQGIPNAPKTGIKPYDKLFGPRSAADSGLFIVHKVSDKYYYEIPDSLLDRDMLMVTRVAKSADGFAYGGQEINNQVLQWSIHDKQVLLKIISYDNISSDPSSPVTQSVKNSNFSPIIAAFEIKAYNHDSSAVVIEITDLFSRDVLPFNISNDARQKYKVQGLDEARSYIESVRSFPLNIEARSVKTYRSADPPSNANSGTISLEINNSMLLLPKKPMISRLADHRVGYFSQTQIDYGSEAEKAKRLEYIVRWRLEPKDSAAYARGELVEPKKPIVFYIDPATPVKWRPYLKQGVNDWNIAFQAAGFKNAIVARDAPDKKTDPGFSLDDARYSVIRYFASEIQNAYGPYVADPRSGEILESHVGWYHNVMNMLKNWYIIQTGAVNPESRSIVLKDSVMGKLIRYVSSHEVGHTLGLMHNMGASYAYPVDSLRSATFTAKNGIVASIMDYARFNFIAQPQDKKVRLIPSIGPYDLYAIHWGYYVLPRTRVPENERDSLNHWILAKHGQRQYAFGRQVSNPIDPRSQEEDLGDNEMKAGMYGIANLKRILPNLEKWTDNPGHDFADLQELFNQVFLQYNRYLTHARTNIGGVYENFKSSDQKGPVYTPVPAAVQREALAFISAQCFETPVWLLNTQLSRRFENAGMIERLRKIQAGMLNGLLDPGRLQRMIEGENLAKKPAYTALEMENDLRRSIWKTVYQQGIAPDDVFRRTLQRAYIDRMEYLLSGNQGAAPEDAPGAGFTVVNIDDSDIRAITRMELKLLGADIRLALPRFAPGIERAHLEDILFRIHHALDPKTAER